MKLLIILIFISNSIFSQINSDSIKYWQDQFDIRAKSEAENFYNAALNRSNSKYSNDYYELAYSIDALTNMYLATKNTNYLDSSLTYSLNVISKATVIGEFKSWYSNDIISINNLEIEQFYICQFNRNNPLNDNGFNGFNNSCFLHSNFKKSDILFFQSKSDDKKHLFINDNKFKIYPNPTQNILKIDYLTDNIPELITISNLTGQILLISKNKSEIDLTELNTGYYLIKIYCDFYIEEHYIVKY